MLRYCQKVRGDDSSAVLSKVRGDNSSVVKRSLDQLYKEIYVTGVGKILHMGFFQKIEFDAWLMTSTIELTLVQVIGRSRAPLWRYSALFAITLHPQLRSKGVAMHVYGVSTYYA